MNSAHTSELMPSILGEDARGAHAPADGNAVGQSPQSASGLPLPGAAPNGAPGVAGQVGPNGVALGPNNERLEEISPRLVNALRELVTMYREESLVARRHEIRRIRQARLFWQGLQYSWWNPQDMNWHLPSEARMADDSTLEDMPRYQFVTNLYQAFGLSFVSLISQDVPSTRFYPQSTLSEADISTARAASEVAKLIEQNNHVEQLLTGLGFSIQTRPAWGFRGTSRPVRREQLAAGPHAGNSRPAPRRGCEHRHHSRLRIVFPDLVGRRARTPDLNVLKTRLFQHRLMRRGRARAFWGNQ